jgi:uncharacterized protein
MGLTEDMKQVVLEQRLGFVATVTRDGRPNLSPKGTTTVLDDEHLVFADIALPGRSKTSPPCRSSKSTSSTRSRGRAIGSRARRRYIALANSSSAAWPSWNSAATGRLATGRAIVVITVSDASALVSPVYTTGATEAEIAASWLEHHRNVNA